MFISVQTIFEAQGSDASKQVPEPLARCVVAVRKKGKDVRDAWNICRASQHKAKNLKGGYSRDEKLKPSVTQTQKGKRVAKLKSKKPDAHKKRAEFSRMFREIEPAVTRNR